MIQAGVAGFKCFLIHSGVDEFPHVTSADLHTAMRQLQGTGSVLLVRGGGSLCTLPIINARYVTGLIYRLLVCLL